MKKLLSLLLTAHCALASFGQANLPTSWSSDGANPAGWTTSGTAFYTGSAAYSAPSSLKLDSDNDYLQIQVADDPGAVTYYLKGSTTGSPWEGIFTVQESVNGTTWSTLRQFTDGVPSVTSYTLYTDVPNPASRYIRFFYTDKISGSNIALDDINIAIPAAGPAQEIALAQGFDQIVNGGYASVGAANGSSEDLTLTVYNLGTVNVLNITSTSITGTNASEFTVTTTPSSTNANSQGDLVISFTPTATGTRTAQLSIVNDDSNENPFIVNLLGYGDFLASEPPQQPTNLVFTNVRSYRFNATFQPLGATQVHYLVLRKTGAAITEMPVDGTTYMRGDNIGDAKVVQSGLANTFSPNFIVAGTQYYFAVFAYTGSGQYTNYLTGVSPLTGNVTTTGANIGNTYSAINTASTSFISDLSALINPHTQIYYNDYEETNIALFASRDTANGQKVVTCVYTSEQFVYDEPFDWSVLSREHTYCASWMPTFPDQDTKEYSDQYNLFPVTFTDANAHRSNYPLGEVVNATFTYMDGKFGTDANGIEVYEPRDQHKGDAARAIFYMATSYNGISSNNWGLPDYISSLIQYGQDQDVLKAWHWQDPPDAWEIARNDFLDSLQGNRNPFVDSVNYACYINFDDMTYIANPGSTPCMVTPGFEETNVETFSVYPNPTSGDFGINISLKENENILVRISDVAGKTVYERNENLKAGNNRLMISSTRLSKGIYMLQLVTENSVNTQKIVIK
jgi:endonuclease I